MHSIDKSYKIEQSKILKSMAKKSPIDTPGDGKVITSWLPTLSANQLAHEAERRGISRSTLARVAILDFLKAQKAETPAT